MSINSSDHGACMLSIPAPHVMYSTWLTFLKRFILC